MEFKYQIVYTMQYFDDFNSIADYYIEKFKNKDLIVNLENHVLVREKLLMSFPYSFTLFESNKLLKHEYGFVMFIRQGKYFKKIMDEYKDAKIIYSMWHGYLDKENGNDRETLRDFFGNREIIELHTSGHATKEAIKKLIDITSPNYVIPIHTEAKEKFREIAGDKLLLANDNEDINI